MKKILLAVVLLFLLGGWVEKPNEKEEAELYYKNGNTKYNLNDFKGAILDFDKTIELNPKFTYAYNNRGNTKYKLKQYKEAILDFDKAIKLNPQYANSYYNRGIAKDKLKQYKEAILDYNKAIELKIETLQIEALHMKKLANTQYEEFSEMKKELLKMNSKIMDEIDFSNQSLNEWKQELAYLETALNEFNMQTQKIDQEIESIQEEIKEVNKKREKASKWYYLIIPGYNLYLAIDASINANNNRLVQLKKKIDQREDERKTILQKIKNIHERVIKSEDTNNKTVQLLIELKNYIVDISQKITIAGNEIKKWNELYIKYGFMKLDLENGLHIDSYHLEILELK